MKTIIAFALSVTLLASCANLESPDSINYDLKTADNSVQTQLEEDKLMNEKSPGFSDKKGIVDGSGDLTKDLRIENLNHGMLVRSKTPEMIIRTANVRMRVEDYKKSRASIEKAVLAAGGYVANENEQTSSYSITNELVIRVTNNAFSQLLNDVAAFGTEVHSKNSASQDVSDAFVDLQSRIKTKKEVEARYIELLKRANTITDILSIENNIRVIREEIEAKEGQLKYLGDQVSYSTINLSVYQTIEGAPSPNEPGFAERFANSFGRGWAGLLEFFIGFVGVWPVWIILGTGTWIFVRFIKKLIRKSKPAMPLQTPSSQV